MSNGIVRRKSLREFVVFLFAPYAIIHHKNDQKRQYGRNAKARNKKNFTIFAYRVIILHRCRTFRVGRVPSENERREETERRRGCRDRDRRRCGRATGDRVATTATAVRAGRRDGVRVAAVRLLRGQRDQERRAEERRAAVVRRRRRAPSAVRPVRAQPAGHAVVSHAVGPARQVLPAGHVVLLRAARVLPGPAAARGTGGRVGRARPTAGRRLRLLRGAAAGRRPRRVRGGHEQRPGQEQAARGGRVVSAHDVRVSGADRGRQGSRGHHQAADQHASRKRDHAVVVRLEGGRRRRERLAVRQQGVPETGPLPFGIGLRAAPVFRGVCEVRGVRPVEPRAKRLPVQGRKVRHLRCQRPLSSHV